MSFFHEVYEKGSLPKIYNLEADKKITTKNRSRPFWKRRKRSGIIRIGIAARTRMKQVSLARLLADLQCY